MKRKTKSANLNLISPLSLSIQRGKGGIYFKIASFLDTHLFRASGFNSLSKHERSSPKKAFIVQFGGDGTGGWKGTVRDSGGLLYYHQADLEQISSSCPWFLHLQESNRPF